MLLSPFELWIRSFEMRRSNYFWFEFKVAVVYKRIGVAIELNVYFKRLNFSILLRHPVAVSATKLPNQIEID